MSSDRSPVVQFSSSKRADANELTSVLLKQISTDKRIEDELS